MRVIHILDVNQKAQGKLLQALGFRQQTIKGTLKSKLVVTGVNPFSGKQGRGRGKTYDGVSEGKRERLDLEETGCLSRRSHGVAG